MWNYVNHVHVGASLWNGEATRLPISIRHLRNRSLVITLCVESGQITVSVDREQCQDTYLFFRQIMSMPFLCGLLRDGCDYNISTRSLRGMLRKTSEHARTRRPDTRVRMLVSVADTRIDPLHISAEILSQLELLI